MIDFYRISPNQRIVNLADFSLSGAESKVFPHQETTTILDSTTMRVVFDLHVSGDMFLDVITRCNTTALAQINNTGVGLVLSSAVPGARTQTYQNTNVDFSSPVVFGRPRSSSRWGQYAPTTAETRGVWGGKFEGSNTYRVVIDTVRRELSIKTVYSIYAIDGSLIYASGPVDELGVTGAANFNGLAFVAQPGSGVLSFTNVNLITQTSLPTNVNQLNSRPSGSDINTKVKVEVSHPDIFYFEGLEEFSSMPFMAVNPVTKPDDSELSALMPHTAPTMTARGVTIRTDSGAARRAPIPRREISNSWWLTPALKLCILPEKFAPLWKSFRNNGWADNSPTGIAIRRSVSHHPFDANDSVDVDAVYDTNTPQFPKDPIIASQHRSRHIGGSRIDSDVLQLYAFGSGPSGNSDSSFWYPENGVCQFVNPAIPLNAAKEDNGRSGRFSAIVGAILLDTNFPPTKETAEIFIDVGDIWGHEYVVEETVAGQESIFTISSKLLAKDVWVRITIPIDTKNFK